MTGRMSPSLIEVRQGDSFTISLYLRKKNKDIDLRGWSCEMQVRDRQNANLMFSVAGEPVDIANGKIALNLTPAMTAIPTGDYDCDIQVISNYGEIHTIYPADVHKVGTFRITKQITR